APPDRSARGRACRTRLRAWLALPWRARHRAARGRCSRSRSSAPALARRPQCRPWSARLPSSLQRVSLERGPDLELKSLDSIAGLLADRRAVAQLQGADRRDPAEAETGRCAQALRRDLVVLAPDIAHV